MNLTRTALLASMLVLVACSPDVHEHQPAPDLITAKGTWIYRHGHEGALSQALADEMEEYLVSELDGKEGFDRASMDACLSEAFIGLFTADQLSAEVGGHVAGLQDGNVLKVAVYDDMLGSAFVHEEAHWLQECQKNLSDPKHTAEPLVWDVVNLRAERLRHTTIEQHPAASTTDTAADFAFASDESPVTFECRLDGASTFTACAATVHYDGLTVGSHSLQARAVDGVGTPDPTPAQFSWTVTQTLALDTTIVSAPPADQAPATAAFTFSSNVEGAGYQCQLDGAAFAACSNPVTFTGLADGLHTLQVRAVAPTGEVSSTPASYQWTVQSSAPVESHSYDLRGGGLGCSESSGGIAGAAALLALLSLLPRPGARRRVR